MRIVIPQALDDAPLVVALLEQLHQTGQRLRVAAPNGERLNDQVVGHFGGLATAALVDAEHLHELLVVGAEGSGEPVNLVDEEVQVLGAGHAAADQQLQPILQPRPRFLR